MKKIYILATFVLSVSLLFGCSDKEDIGNLTKEEVINIINEKELVFIIEKEHRNEKAKTYSIQGFLENDKSEKLEINIYDTRKGLLSSKKQEIKNRNNPNLDRVFPKIFYVRNVSFIYLSDDISKNQKGKYEKELEEIVQEINNAD